MMTCCLNKDTTGPWAAFLCQAHGGGSLAWLNTSGQGHLPHKNKSRRLAWEGTVLNLSVLYPVQSEVELSWDSLKGSIDTMALELFGLAY